jgi:hypothetical protein
MGKKIKFEIDIVDAIEFNLNQKQRLKLVEYIIYNLLTGKNLSKFTRKFIEDIKSDEEEFGMEEDFINACDVILSKLENVS